MRLLLAPNPFVMVIAVLVILFLSSEPSRTVLPKVAEVASPIVGPSCTIAYPRGFTVYAKAPPKHTKTPKALSPPTCTNGDLGATWGHCVQRYPA